MADLLSFDTLCIAGFSKLKYFALKFNTDIYDVGTTSFAAASKQNLQLVFAD